MVVAASKIEVFAVGRNISFNGGVAVESTNTIVGSEIPRFGLEITICKHCKDGQDGSEVCQQISTEEKKKGKKRKREREKERKRERKGVILQHESLHPDLTSER